MSSLSLPRLRQIALVTGDLDAACAAVEDDLGLADPFHDPGVGDFGLANAVYEAGDTFLEIVAPRQEGTTAGRYLDKRGGAAGYMAIFQVSDTAATRSRAEDMGLRTAWKVDLDDISATHLHPKDIAGAIVSFDTPQAAASWRWAGPRWTGQAPPDRRGQPGNLAGLVVRLLDVDAGARAWAGVLDADLTDGVMRVEGGRQQVRFEPASDPGDEGISAVELSGLAGDHIICGVRFMPPG